MQGPTDVEIMKLLEQSDLTISRCVTPLQRGSQQSLSSFRHNFLRSHNSFSSHNCTLNEAQGFTLHDTKTNPIMHFVLPNQPNNSARLLPSLETQNEHNELVNGPSSP